MKLREPFPRRSVRRIALLAGLLTLLTGVLIALDMRESAQAASALNWLSLRPARMVYEALLAIEETADAEDDASRTHQRALLDSLLSELDITIVALRQGDAQRGVRPPRDSAVLAAITAVQGRWLAELRPALIEAAERGADDGGAALSLQLLARDFARDINEAQELVISTTAAATARLNLAKLALRALLLMGIATWLALVLYTARRLRVLKSAAQRISTGDLSARGAVSGSDEVTELSRAFDDMADKIQSMVERESRFFEFSQSLLCIAGYDGHFKRLNPAWERTLGYPTAELLARPWLDFVHPEDRERTVAEARRLLADGSETTAFENRYVAKDGSVHVFSWNVVPSPAEQLLYCVVTDVTLRSKAEAAYRDLIESTLAIVATHDLEGRLLSVNPSGHAILGFGPQELVGTNLADLIEPRVRGEFASYLERIRQRGTDGGVLHLKTKNGADRFVEYRNVLRQDADGRSVVVTHAQDITEERKLSEQLRQAQKLEAVGQLTGGIAHDFNNILTVIGANAELIGAESVAETVRDYLRDLTSAATSGAALIRQLLGFSRQAQLNLRPVALHRVTEQAAGMLKRMLPEHIEVAANLAEVPPVLADSAAVQQILLNLATNARDAMPEGGRLTMETGSVELDDYYRDAHPWVVPGEYVWISCTDTGVGMDPATQERIFDPFFTTKPVGVGTGLGMSMCYGLMKQHGGFIHVYSEPGRGTTVKLYFPTAGIEALDVVPEQRPDLTSLQGKGETILLVEDQETLRRTGRRILERFGYRVIEAENGAQALELYRKHTDQIALILTDLVMPVVGGRQLYEAVRRQAPHAKFVFASGYAARDASERALDAGVAFLQKPWTLPDFARTIREALDEPGS